MIDAQERLRRDVLDQSDERVLVRGLDLPALRIEQRDDPFARCARVRVDDLHGHLKLEVACIVIGAAQAQRSELML